MIKSKRILAMLLSASMLMACMTGCGKQEVSGTEKGSESSVESAQDASSQIEEEKLLYNVGTLPIVNEKITLKVLTQDAAGYAWDTADKSGYWAWLEEKTGIHFEVESYQKEELSSKLALIMATPDEMPDIFFNTGLSEADIMSYGSNGQILVLDEYIEEYGANIKTAFDTVDGLKGGATSMDGHIYSIPSINNSPSHVQYALNSRFMENAGLDPEKDAPATIEELYEVFKAIKKADANGDGTVGNEICWTGNPKNFKRQALSMVGIACYWPWEGVIFDQKDDEVFFVPTSEEYKYLLSWLHTFYEEGMLDNEIFTQTGEQRTAKINGDLVFMSESFDDPEKPSYKGRSGAFFLDTPITSAVSDEPIHQVAALYNSGVAFVSANTEYPEVCMLLLDYIYSEEASKVATFGLENVDYVINDKGVVASASADFGLRYGPTGASVNVWRKDNQWFDLGDTALTKAMEALKTNYGKMGFQNYLKFTDEQSTELSTLSADLGLYCDDYYVGVVTGNYDLEKTWDEYVKKCEGMNLEKITEIYQSAYNVFYGLE